MSLAMFFLSQGTMEYIAAGEEHTTTRVRFSSGSGKGPSAPSGKLQQLAYVFDT